MVFRSNHNSSQQSSLQYSINKTYLPNDVRADRVTLERSHSTTSPLPKSHCSYLEVFPTRSNNTTVSQMTFQSNSLSSNFQGGSSADDTDLTSGDDDGDDGTDISSHSVASDQCQHSSNQVLPSRKRNHETMSSSSTVVLDLPRKKHLVEECQSFTPSKPECSIDYSEEDLCVMCQ